MARVADYSNTHKYSNRRSFDGQPVPVGMVLVPFRKDLYDLKEDDYIDANFTTMHLGEIPYVIGFMPIKEECFEGYMKDFWAEINADMLKGLLERYNPNRIEMLSIDYEYDGETFDIEDTTQPPLEDQVLDKLCPGPTVEELQVQLLAHFDKENPRYAKIIRLSLQGVPIDDICVQINLKPSRGRQEINNAHDAVCEYLRLRHHKKNRK